MHLLFLFDGDDDDNDDFVERANPFLREDLEDIDVAVEFDDETVFLVYIFGDWVEGFFSAYCNFFFLF